MILFYDTITGEIFASVEGRVHDSKQMGCVVDNGSKNVGKYIIGWEQVGNEKIEHNLKDFELLKLFESTFLENPLDYKIVDNNLVKK